MDNSEQEPFLENHVKLERKRRPPKSRIRWAVVALFGTYFCIAYLLMPEAWHHYLQRHPALDEVPGITETHSGIPGDPVNIALVGTREQVVGIMLQARWMPADPLTLENSLRIAADTMFRRKYVDAPVSSLYLFGRKEDLAFEFPVGNDPKQRHHVRFWESPICDSDGRPFWFGAVTFDKSVGFSHTTGQITHHIDGNVDAERDRLLAALNATGDLQETYAVPNFHEQFSGRNGGGDRWWTNGTLRVGIIQTLP